MLRKALPTISRSVLRATTRNAPVFVVSSLSFSTSTTSILRQEQTYFNTSVNSYEGMSSKPFSEEASKILAEKIDPETIEIRPDGLIYLSESSYRRILIKAFGPGGWSLVQRGAPVIENTADGKINVSREFALFCDGRFVSEAWGEMTIDARRGSVTDALEGAKSKALSRCCKDLGIATDLWDPQYTIEWKAKYAAQILCESNGKNKTLWRRKDRPPFAYPFKEIRELPQAKSSELLDVYDVSEDSTSAPSYSAPKTQQQQQPLPTLTGPLELDAQVPQSFKKIAHMTWGQALSEKSGRGYLTWVVAESRYAPEAKAQCAAYLKVPIEAETRVALESEGYDFQKEKDILSSSK